MFRFSNFLALAAASVCALASIAADPVKPNIVLILADDLGINDLHCYGRKDHRTPNLDALAKSGARFTTAYTAQPICSPSRAALMTGKCPARLHLTNYLPGRADAPSQKLIQPIIEGQLPLEEPTVAEWLRGVGYATGLFGKWHLGNKGFSPAEQASMWSSLHRPTPNQVQRKVAKVNMRLPALLKSLSNRIATSPSFAMCLTITHTYR